MSYTENDIWKCLIATGRFHDPHEFALERLRDNLSERRVSQLGVRLAVEEHEVGTGRTTRMMVRALAEAASHADKTVVVCAHTKAWATSIVQGIYRLADLIDLPVQAKLEASQSKLTQRGCDITYFFDHSCRNGVGWDA